MYHIPNKDIIYLPESHTRAHDTRRATAMTIRPCVAMYTTSLFGMVESKWAAAPPNITVCGILRVCGIYRTGTLKVVQCYAM